MTDRNESDWPAAAPSERGPRRRIEHAYERLLGRLPGAPRRWVRWLRRPSSRWARLPVGVLLVLGGVFSFLPLLGLWMLPLGLAVLAEDVPALRRQRDRAVVWIARRRPHWLGEAES